MRRERKEEEAGLDVFYLLCIVELSVASVSQVCVTSNQYCEEHNSTQSFLALADLSKIIFPAFSSRQ